MKLNVIVDERLCVVDVPTHLFGEAEDFFRKMDSDMDRGWQMGPEFIENPDKLQRCQIAANKLLTSLSAANETMVTLMAGYILKRVPGVTGVRIDTAGEMLHTEFLYDKPAVPTAPMKPASPKRQLSKLEAMEQAGQDVTKVYRVGRSYRFAVRDLKSGEWLESGPMETEQEAFELRMQAYKRRLDELTAS